MSERDKCVHANKDAPQREGDDLVRYCLDCGREAVRLIDYYKHS